MGHACSVSDVDENSPNPIIFTKLFCPFLPNLSLTKITKILWQSIWEAAARLGISVVFYTYLAPSESTIGVWKNDFVKVGKLLGKTIFSDNGVPDTLNI